MEIENNKVRITFFGGLGEVGGNLVLLEDLMFDVRVIIDFGINIKKFYEIYEKGKAPSNIEELIDKSLLPDPQKLSISNLYRNYEPSKKVSDKYLNTNNLTQKKELDGVFISHPHKDHFWGLNFINPSIPVYTGIVTRNIIIALSDSDKKGMMNDYKGVNWKVFRTGNVIRIKDMIIVPSHVDHSVPASYGFIFYTSAGPVVYTGDFRRHGPLAFMTDDFLNEIKNHKLYREYIEKNPQLEPVPLPNIKLLMVEGTRIAKGTIEAEEFVEKNLEQLFEMNPFNFMLVKYERTDWDRFRTFSDLAKKYGWNFVIGERDAFFYYILNQDRHHKTMKDPNILNDDHILIVKWGPANLTWKRKFRKIMEDNGKSYRLFDSYESLPQKVWIEKIKVGASEGKQEIERTPKYMFFITHLHPDIVKYLEKYGTNNRGVFISSSIDQYTEDAYDNTENTIGKLRKYGITGYKVHASGHVNCHALLDFIDNIRPEILVPMHTNFPELFKQFYSKNVFQAKLAYNIDMDNKGKDFKIKVISPAKYGKIELN